MEEPKVGCTLLGLQHFGGIKERAGALGCD